jgi:hypothetical protein
MNCELSLTCIRLATLGTGYGKIAVFGMLIELGLALEDSLATYTLEVVLLKMIVQCHSVGTIEAATWL